MSAWGKGQFAQFVRLTDAMKLVGEVRQKDRSLVLAKASRSLRSLRSSSLTRRTWTQRRAHGARIDSPAIGADTGYMSEMFDRMMESAARLQARPVRPAPVLPTPDYEALVEALTNLYRIPDGLGETVLRTEEAAKIRKCGFDARAGIMWRCPPLPDSLVSWNPLLQHLSDAIDPLNRPAGWRQKRAPSRLIRQFHPISKVERLILRHLGKEPYYMTKRRLQQKMWRYSARFFNRTISGMIAANTITMYQNYLFPYSRQLFNECILPAINGTGSK
jgi:hypothetical protein